MLLVVGFIIYSGTQALRDAKSDLNPVDELSKKITQKASATAFHISIYMWLSGLFILDRFAVDSVNKAKFVIATGMMGVTLLFLFIRLYVTTNAGSNHLIWSLLPKSLSPTLLFPAYGHLQM